MSGNVVVGFATDGYLMLDYDLARRERIVEWVKGYCEENELGSALIMKTSTSTQMDLFGNELNNFCIIFGAPLPWQEILLHMENAYQDGIVDKKFLNMRFYGLVTERVNRKNGRIDHPKISKIILNGNVEGCKEYLGWWRWNREVGAQNGG